MKQAHIFFVGMVQGVGFRYTAQRIASGLKLKGWVRNLADGRVELVAEGPQEDIEQLCHKLDEHFQSYIRSKNIVWNEASNGFKDFAITG